MILKETTPTSMRTYSIDDLSVQELYSLLDLLKIAYNRAASGEARREAMVFIKNIEGKLTT